MEPTPPLIHTSLPPCDLCHTQGIGWLKVPRKRYRLKQHSSAWVLRMAVERLWLCDAHRTKMGTREADA